MSLAERGKTEREVNVRMKPITDDGPVRTHAQRAIGSDHTLCGFTLDGDRTCVEWEAETSDPITCEQCWAIIEFCRSIKQRKIATEKGAVTR